MNGSDLEQLEDEWTFHESLIRAAITSRFSKSYPPIMHPIINGIVDNEMIALIIEVSARDFTYTFQ